MASKTFRLPKSIEKIQLDCPVLGRQNGVDPNQEETVVTFEGADVEKIRVDGQTHQNLARFYIDGKASSLLTLRVVSHQGIVVSQSTVQIKGSIKAGSITQTGNCNTQATFSGMVIDGDINLGDIRQTM
ncbi:hypothetical protein [Leptolyngbya sp. AN10]|uniref:hypothetical protein n=1 Tax=Leptolyngbya sp. AN10 TaxID=3423365 RepID=UPI003D31D4CA